METISEIKQALCNTFCADIEVIDHGDGFWHVVTPFSFADGDSYPIYLERQESGTLRLTDKGRTLMHLSYEMDVEKLQDGIKGRIFNQVVGEMGLSEDNGEFYQDIDASMLGRGVMQFGQALTRLHDANYMNRVHSESTFYEDLRILLTSVVDANRIKPDYLVPELPQAEQYNVDYCITATVRPIFLFGVPSSQKARLATIVLQHLLTHNVDFYSVVVYSNMADIPRGDVSRLTNAANDQLSALSEKDVLRRKLSLVS